jgi:hypothetical protein
VRRESHAGICERLVVRFHGGVSPPLTNLRFP